MNINDYQYISPQGEIKLPQKTANFLVELYYEMIEVWTNDKAFDQDQCSVCVIGNAIRSGICNFKLNHRYFRANGQPGIGTFREAVDKINIDYPACDYLFGNSNEVISGGYDLRLPIGVNGADEDALTSLDACVRIAAVLDRAGYDVSELPDIPQS